jgi:hypothetical protein
LSGVRGTLGRALCVVALAAVALFGGALPAAADTEELDELAGLPCPAPYNVVAPQNDVEYTAEEQAAARAGDFRIFSDFGAHLVPPVDWLQDPFQSYEYRSRLHDWQWLNVLLYSYATNGDVDALGQARDLMLDWIAVNREGRSKTPALAWINKTTAKRASYLAYLVRAGTCAGILSRSQADTLLHSVAKHAAWLAASGHYTPTNIGLMESYSLWQIGDQYPFLYGADGWKQRALSRVHSTVADLTLDGVWLEHSDGYQFLAIKLLDHFLELIGADPTLDGALAELREGLAWFVEPDEDFVQFGHTDLVPTPPDWAIAEAAGQEGISPTAEAGVAVVRDGGAWLGLTGGYFSNYHKTDDDLSFDLFDQGHRVIEDSGRYSYDIVPERTFAESAKAHSVVLADDKGFQHEGAAPYGSAIQATGESAADGWYGIRAVDRLSRRHGIKHSRLLLYKPGLALIVVDKLRSEQRHTYTRLFQLGSDIDVTTGSAKYLNLSAAGFSGRLHDESPGEGVKRTLLREGNNPPRGFTFPDFRIKVPRWTARYESKRTRNADFVTTVSLDSAVLPARAKLLSSSSGTKVDLLTTGGVRLWRITATPNGAQLAISAVSG